MKTSIHQRKDGSVMAHTVAYSQAWQRKTQAESDYRAGTQIKPLWQAILAQELFLKPLEKTVGAKRVLWTTPVSS